MFLFLVEDIHDHRFSFIFKEKLCPKRFSWQEGYGGFKYSRSQLNDLYKYIENQENHHKNRTFYDEYIDYLNTNEMEFNEEFLPFFWEYSV